MSGCLQLGRQNTFSFPQLRLVQEGVLNKDYLAWVNCETPEPSPWSKFRNMLVTRHSLGNYSNGREDLRIIENEKVRRKLFEKGDPSSHSTSFVVLSVFLSSLSLSISISVCSHLASCKSCTSHFVESVKRTSEILRAPVTQRQLAVSTPGSSLNFQGEAFGARALELWISGSLGDGTQSLAVGEGGGKIGGALEAKGSKGAAENRYECDTVYVCFVIDGSSWINLPKVGQV